MTRKYNIAVFIGRFQPIHLGHLSVIEEALKQADHVVLLVGSASSPRCYRNPFTYKERKSMIYHSIPGHDRDRINIMPLEDSAYNDSRWIKNVQTQVTAAVWTAGYTYMPKITLIGHNKDSTSFYLKMFPQWENINVSNHLNHNSTSIRESYFSNISHMWLTNCDGHKPGDLQQDRLVTTYVKEFLESFYKTAEYKSILSEYEFINNYKKGWISAPYPPIFSTVDAIVVQSGHVLMVKRKEIPGKGLWALPGGFINQHERIIDAVFRELSEETKIKVPEKVLRGSIDKVEVFDDPNRSARGRTITHAYLIKLEDNESLPKVKGSDDALVAQWIPIVQLKREEIFEDHFDIINCMLGL